MNPGPYPISARQLEELASPVKQLIIDAFRQNREAQSIREIAEQINRAPDSLYYHFRSLLKAGLIVSAGSRLESGKPVQLYRPVARNLKVRYQLQNKRFRKIICRILDAAIRLANRDFHEGIGLPQARAEVPTRNLYMCRMEAWLTRGELREINRRMDEIVDIMSRNGEPGRGERCSVFMSLAPQPVRNSDAD